MLFLALLALRPLQDISNQAQAALDQFHFYQVPATAPEFILHDVTIPPNATFDGGGALLHVPVTSRFGLKLVGPNARANNATLVCDLQPYLSKGSIDRDRLPTSLPVGIDCAEAGSRVRDCTVSWFGVGIHSTCSKPQIMPMGETMIEGCQVVNPVDIGIDFERPSDSMIRGCVVGRPAGGPNARYGIRFAGGAGYVDTCHVWGAFNVSVEIASPDAIVTGLTAEGGRETLLRLADWRIQVRDAFLYYPIGQGKTNAIEAGIVGGPSAAYCKVEARIGGLGGLAFKSIIFHSNDAFGNDYDLRFDRPTGWPPVVSGIHDTLKQTIQRPRDQ
jgi:hypothetical protein